MINILTTLDLPGTLLAVSPIIHALIIPSDSLFAIVGLLMVNAQIWHAVPLIVVISLVYGATRHEHLPEILTHSLRSMIWVAGFMGIIFALIWIAGFWN